MAATPSGRVPLSGFGMFTRRDGVARYAPECTRLCRSANRPSSPSSYIRHVMPSAPAAASLFNSKNAQRSASTVTWWRSAVRRSRGSRCTNCRIRSAACVTLSRLCVRRMLWPSRFPSGSVLRSIGSARADAPLFADFAAVGSEEAPVGAGLRPPLKRLVQFSRKPLSQRCLIEGSRKESERSGVQVRTRQ